MQEIIPNLAEIDNEGRENPHIGKVFDRFIGTQYRTVDLQEMIVARIRLPEGHNKSCIGKGNETTLEACNRQVCKEK